MLSIPSLPPRPGGLPRNLFTLTRKQGMRPRDLDDDSASGRVPPDWPDRSPPRRWPVPGREAARCASQPRMYYLHALIHAFLLRGASGGKRAPER